MLMSGLAPLGMYVFAIFLHEAIANQDQKAHWALDGVCLAFNQHLAGAGAQGFVVVDNSKELRRDDLADVASGRLSVSIFRSELDRVRGVSLGHVESALPLQAVDVVIGSIRYCLEKPSHDVSVELAGSVSHFSGKLERRPWNVKTAGYAKDYTDFESDWRDLGTRFRSKQSATND
jgi:hypothetical protein